MLRRGIGAVRDKAKFPKPDFGNLGDFDSCEIRTDRQKAIRAAIGGAQLPS